jgi:antibiotic biosynthesis monooxygenase (ABM) superfamily enzyme
MAMIVRSWEGATRRSDAERYAAYVEETGIAALTSTPGCSGAEIQRRLEGDRAIFRVESRWESVEAMRAFAGDDPTIAVFFPEDDAYLVERDRRVLIWEVAASSAPAAGARAGERSRGEHT